MSNEVKITLKADSFGELRRKALQIQEKDFEFVLSEEGTYYDPKDGTEMEFISEK